MQRVIRTLTRCVQQFSHAMATLALRDVPIEADGRR
jgi:hypothetical protein